tara:strand:- start:842 stop:1825 length:984 start_codon:yes stop_codon:yes gene_type:complete
MSQAQPAVAPSSYVAAAPAPQAVAAPQAPVAYQVGTSYPQAVPQAVPSYQSTPIQYAPQSQPAPEAPQVGNPWESAFNKVVNLLSTPVQSPFQGQPSQQTTQYTPANYGVTSNPATFQSDPQTWSTNPTSYSNSSRTSSMSSGKLYGLEAQAAHAEVNNAIADYYNLSDESRDVINAHGVEAPAILNQYALNLEGLVDSALAWGSRATSAIRGYANFAVNEHNENLAYNEILTNPDTLSDYTLKFFGPEGPYPVYESEAELETPGIRTATPGAQYNFPAPPSSAAPQTPQNFWGTFQEQMARDPQQAWRILNQAQPQTVANKLFVME